MLEHTGDTKPCEFVEYERSHRNVSGGAAAPSAAGPFLLQTEWR